MSVSEQEIVTRLESIEAKIGTPKSKDVWDKLAIVSAFLSSFVLALVIFGVGLWFEHRTKLRDDARVERESASEQSKVDRELIARELDVVAKFLPYLGEQTSENDHRQAIELISNLATVEVAAAVAKAVGSRGAEAALNTIARQSDLTSSGRDAVSDALRSLAERNPIVDSVDPSMGLRESSVFQSLSDAQRQKLFAVIRATGKIKIKEHPTLPYAGTGFLISPTLVLTTDYTAETFAPDLPKDGRSVAPKYPVGIDFGGTLNAPDEDALTVASVISVSLGGTSNGKVALLEVSGSALSEILPVSIGSITDEDSDADVAVVGFPSFDPRMPAEVSMAAFGTDYGIKRVLFGKIIGEIAAPGFTDDDGFAHDAVTSGGVGGAPVVRLRDGAVVGVHYSGYWREWAKEGGAVKLDSNEFGKQNTAKSGN